MFVSIINKIILKVGLSASIFTLFCCYSYTRNIHGKVACVQDHDKVNATISGENGINLLMIVHELLMILSWMLLSPTSLILARYYRRGTFVNHTVTHTWSAIFQVHNVLMYASAAVMLLAFVIISPRLAAISAMGKTDLLHTVLGVIALVGVMAMVVMGTMAPKSSSPKRPAFNIVHRICGKIIQLFAAIVMIEGYHSPKISAGGCVMGTTVVTVWYTSLFILELSLDLYTIHHNHQIEMRKKNGEPESLTNLKWPTNVFFGFVTAMAMYALMAWFALFN